MRDAAETAPHPVRAALLAVTIAALAIIAAVALAATPVQNDATPAQIVVKQKRTIAMLRDQRDDLRQERDAQNAVIEDLQADNARLRSRIANWPDPIDVITARDPAGLFAAVQAIWAVFPVGPTGLCGYDRSSTQNDGLTPDILSFYRYTVC